MVKINLLLKERTEDKTTLKKTKERKKKPLEKQISM